MKIGMPVLVELKDIYKCIEAAKEYSLDFIEINMSFPNYQLHSKDWARVREIATEKGITFTIHADEQMNPFDFNPMVSRCYFECMKQTIALAKTIGAGVINMHLLKGVYVTLPDRVVLLQSIYIDEYLSRVKAFISLCEREIAEENIVISIENVDSNLFTDAQLKALELFMDSRVFGLTFDVGHNECLGGGDFHVFEKYRSKLVHMHLHDSDGKHAHLPLGDGRVDISKRLEILPCDRTCLIEVKTLDGLSKSLNYLDKMDLRR